MPQKTQNTPMMEQYLEIKSRYPDAFLFYRLGDFYELFNDDAIRVAQLLELTLTSRNKNADEPIPMCGVPHHAAESYIDSLIEQGYKVAICEQMEDPKLTKGMVKRDVTRVVTPGTVMASSKTGDKESNYLVALEWCEDDNCFGLAYVDLSTGELKATRLDNEDSVVNECTSLQSKEILQVSPLSEKLEERLKLLLNVVYSFPNSQKDEPREVDRELTSGLDDSLLKEVTNQLVLYLFQTQKRALNHLQPAESYSSEQFLQIDHASKMNLELTSSLRTGKKQGTLLWLLDKTKTAMGSRLLKQWIERPLINESMILNRQASVQNLVNHFFERVELQELFQRVYDLERLVGKVSFGTVNGRDLLQLNSSLNQLPSIIEVLNRINENKEWTTLLKMIQPLDNLVELIETSISEDAPLSVADGGVIKDGFNHQLDTYREAMRNGKRWLAELEAKEREETGIRTLKIGFNRVFGYYIEVTKSNLKQLPEGKYERKQTLTNAERFITPELKEKETLILEAEEKSKDLEYELFVSIREEIKKYTRDLQTIAQGVASLDVFQSFATVSEENRYVLPEIHIGSEEVSIVNGRHPVVESVLGSQTYVPNDIRMDKNREILLITGPNMSGKSTYMRQFALTVVLAQIGCFVPAESANLPIFDQIFTRIGASDDLFSGQSTFMVEMTEANNALQHATRNSLILFDELGRGTATYDGMALAEAIIEYLHSHVHAKTLFSTHYHELTSLEEKLSGVKNCHVGAVEENGNVVFLHKMLDGPSDKSYGIHVAKLAGMPDELLQRATSVLAELESGNNILAQVETQQKTVNEFSDVEQVSLFETVSIDEMNVLDQLKQLNVMELTPLDALNKLYFLQKEL